MKTIYVMTSGGPYFAQAFGSIAGIAVVREPWARTFCIVHVKSGRAVLRGFTRLGQAKEARSALAIFPSWGLDWPALEGRADLREMVRGVEAVVRGTAKARESESSKGQADPSVFDLHARRIAREDAAMPKEIRDMLSPPRRS